ncbi:MAG: TetR/AcrR family transcriptional regulator [Myxococcales bacterium]|nr:TetR/AcrR family transcriptional regulator [Myxococcales bacterium]MDH3843908.1 TetR/AcrR family transcriptional regulator [Myxococcales bacterium]
MLNPDRDESARKMDGRFRRSERSKAAIVNALLDLIGEGTPEPTADEVAERAAIGSRTVFRHFKDMETLYAAMDAIIEARYGPMMAAPVPKCALKERISEFVARRTKLYEGVAPIKRAANIKRPHSEFLQERHEAAVRRLGKDLHRWFPELKNKKPATVHAIELLTSIEAWDRLRLDQRLGKKRAAEAMENALSALLL